MNALRSLAIAALAVGLPLAGLADLQRGASSLPGELNAIARLAAGPSAAPSAAMSRRDVAEVVLAFDGAGHVSTHALRRSSGSSRSDAVALREAMELASLRRPSDLAGRTVLFSASFDGAPQLD